MPGKGEQGRWNETQIKETGLGFWLTKSAAASGVVEDEGKLVKEVVRDEVDHVLELLVDGERALRDENRMKSFFY